MLDEVEETGGKINWPAAVVVSVIVHVVLFGFFWMISGTDKVKPDATPEAPVSAPTSGTQPEPAVPDPAPVQDATPPSVTPVPPTTTIRPPVQNPPVAPAHEEIVDYVVKPGDFLSRIANKCKCTVADIKRINGAAADKVLHPGDVLKVPVRH